MHTRILLRGFPPAVAMLLVPAGARAAQLYSVDVLTNTLVTLDTVTGAVTVVGVTGLPFTPVDLAALDGSLWAIERFGTEGIPHHLHELDPATGAQVGHVPVLLDGSPTGRAPGLAARDGALVVAFSPDPASSQATHVGALGFDGTIEDVVDFESFGADLFGLATAPDGDTLFSVGGNGDGQLRQVVLDPRELATIGGGELDNVNDLVFAGDDLWALSSTAQLFSDLHRIDPATGEILETISIDVLPAQSLFSGLAFPAAACTEDLDADGSVGVGDLLALLAAWGPNPGHAADLDGDGAVSVTDLLQLLGAWGSCGG